MAGRKYAVVLYARTPPSYHALSDAEKAKPGRAFEATLKKFSGRVDAVRRYWTSAFTQESSDIFILEADDPMDLHTFQEDLDKAFAKLGGDPARFGSTVHVSFGINPDAEAPKRGRRG
jgi:hypothetical protein